MRFSHHYSSISLIQASQSLIFLGFRTGFHSPFTQMQTFSASKVGILKSTPPLSIVHACRLTLSTQFDRTITNLNTMKEKKTVKNEKRISQSNLRDPL